MLCSISGHCCHVNGRKLKQNPSSSTFTEYTFWTWGIAAILKKVGNKSDKNKNKFGTMHLRVSLIVFDQAGRHRWAAAQNYCGSINPRLFFFFFFFAVMATELGTASVMMCTDVFQCSCHSKHQRSSAGQWPATADSCRARHLTNAAIRLHLKI